MLRRRLLVCFVPCAVALYATILSAEDKVSFDRQIRPILSDKCYFCHGPDEKERAADLRLDDEASAKKKAIVPGNLQASELIARIESHDADTQMPPPSSKLALTSIET